MEGRCETHPFEAAEDLCRECGREYCKECLVFAFGPEKPPFCVACAISAAGIRKHAGKPPAVSRKKLRRLEKERRKARKRSTEAPVAVKAIDVARALDEDAGPAAAEQAPAAEPTDWSAPFESDPITASR